MALRAVIVLVALLSGGCASRTTVVVPPSQRTFSTPPAALDVMVLIVCERADGPHFAGLATPISPTSLLTAYHVIDECPSLSWRANGAGGPLIVAKAQPCPSNTWQERDCDWALLVIQESGPRFERWASVSRDEPISGETLWWRLLLPGGVMVAAGGSYLGRDGADHVHVWGISHPGSSGSGLFNGDGQLVGVLSGCYAPAEGRNATTWGTRMAGILR